MTPTLNNTTSLEFFSDTYFPTTQRMVSEVRDAASHRLVEILASKLRRRLVAIFTHKNIVYFQSFNFIVKSLGQELLHWKLC